MEISLIPSANVSGQFHDQGGVTNYVVLRINLNAVKAAVCSQSRGAHSVWKPPGLRQTIYMGSVNVSGMYHARGNVIGSAGWRQT